jgi:DNA-binding transcriptional MocR family regulator
VADPKYKRIADDLRDQIIEGALKPGSQLPTELNLASASGASRNTIRLAIGLLSNHGLVETRHGIGTFVAQPPARLTVLLSREEDWRAGEPADAALRPTGELASRPTTAKFQAEKATASTDVADELSLPAGSAVMLRRSDEMGSIPAVHTTPATSPARTTPEARSPSTTAAGNRARKARHEAHISAAGVRPGASRKPAAQ